jgi:hypothetical protein
MNGLVRGRKTVTTIPAKNGVRAGDMLNRQFTAPRPNHTWVTDFTYVPTNIGSVGNQKAIRGGRDEPAFDQVRRPVRQRSWDCRSGSFGSTDTAKALPFHQPFDRATGDLPALPAQLGVNFPNTVNAVVRRMDLVDARRQGFIGNRS